MKHFWLGQCKIVSLIINNYKCKAIFRAYQTDFFRAYVGGRCEQLKRSTPGAVLREKRRGREGGREVGRRDRERNGRERKREEKRETQLYTHSVYCDVQSS